MSPYENKMILANYNLVHDKHLIDIFWCLNTKDEGMKEEMREDRRNEGRID